MHKRIAAIFPREKMCDCAFTPSSGKTEAGFSLVEVSLAIAIVAFAFIALIGLLPTGMQVFRGSMDTANENWIMQDINSVVQTTPWEKVDEMGAGGSNAVFFAYDDEGKLLERVDGATLPAGGASSEWQYIVKVLVEKIDRPNTSGDLMPDCRNVIVVIAPCHKAKAVAEFNVLTSGTQLQNAGEISKNTDLRVRSFVVTRMDALL
jgi:uncharacterized protein (TIGR02598 family)